MTDISLTTLIPLTDMVALLCTLNTHFGTLEQKLIKTFFKNVPIVYLWRIHFDIWQN